MNVHFGVGNQHVVPTLFNHSEKQGLNSPKFGCSMDNLHFSGEDTVHFGHGSPIVHPDKIKNSRRGAWTRLKRAKKIPKDISLNDWLIIGEPTILTKQDYQAWVRSGKPDQSKVHRSKRK